jgi:hypothetical protein
MGPSTKASSNFDDGSSKRLEEEEEEEEDIDDFSYLNSLTAIEKKKLESGNAD